LAVKEDPSTPPADASAIQAMAPSHVFSWAGLSAHLNRQSERIGIENNWFAVTGRVVAVMAETDGDLHIELRDATGDKPGIVVVEVPAKPQWCEIRKTVFGWAQTQFPFHTSSGRKLNIANPPVITVVGKAFFDTDHALQKQFNRRKRQPYHAAWEIHPVMKLTVQ
jgi:hypothetical protein